MVVICLLWNASSWCIIGSFLLLFTTVTTGCFKILNSTLKYVCFTMISTFNLTPSATGTTGRDSHKTLRFYWLVWSVASCPSSLALKYKEILLISCSDLCFSATIMIGCAGRNLLFLNRFLLSWDVSCVRLCCGMVSVCRLLLCEFLWALSGTGMTSLLGCSEM